MTKLLINDELRFVVDDWTLDGEINVVPVDFRINSHDFIEALIYIEKADIFAIMPLSELINSGSTWHLLHHQHKTVTIEAVMIEVEEVNTGDTLYWCRTAIFKGASANQIDPPPFDGEF